MATLKQALNAKGCITVSFEFLRDLREVNVENKPRKRKELLTALDEIPEKALKGDALSHQVVYVRGPKACVKSKTDNKTAYQSLKKFATGEKGTVTHTVL
jgi:hypothetical protein